VQDQGSSWLGVCKGPLLVHGHCVLPGQVAHELLGLFSKGMCPIHQRSALTTSSPPEGHQNITWGLGSQ
jgi:hypothetical protein